MHFKVKKSMGKLHILLLLLFIHSYTAQRILEDSTGDICTGKDCGQGKCAAIGAPPGFECQCYPGWTKLLLFPACTLPNCSLSLNCGKDSPPLFQLPPPLVIPPLPSLLPPLPPLPPLVLPPLPSILPPLPTLPPLRSILPPLPPLPSLLPPLLTVKESTATFNACIIVYCGPEGTCIPNGLTYYCKCNEGAANLFDSPGVACFKECAIGGDCKNVSLVSGTSKQDSPNVTNGSTKSGHAIVLMICLILLSFI